MNQQWQSRKTGQENAGVSPLVSPVETDRGPAGEDDESRHVAVLDENEIRGEITANWIREGVPCDIATDPGDLLGLLDMSYPVVCIRHSGDWYEDLVRYLWDSYPHLQILLLLDREEFTSIDRECDEQLQEPYGKDQLQDAVNRLFGRGLYTLKLREYYQLTSYIAGSEERPTDLAQETVERIEGHVHSVEREIESITGAFDGADFEGVLQSHRRRERALGTPSMDAEEETRSKYRPSSCPKCGLAWGAAHGGRLGDGVERVAALVWRCMNCGDVLKVSPGEYDKIL